ncbi:hypothetical protein [Streptomyces sp. NPDC088789]
MRVRPGKDPLFPACIAITPDPHSQVVIATDGTSWAAGSRER